MARFSMSTALARSMSAAATRLAARAMRPLRNQRMNALASERGWATGMIGGGLDSNLLAEARAPRGEPRAATAARGGGRFELNPEPPASGLNPQREVF